MREAASWIAPSARTTRPEGSPPAADPPNPRAARDPSCRDAGESARRAEPRGIGSASARDPLAREVKLLGALLGQVIVEQEGPELFELVEQLRRAAIRGRKAGPEETIERALQRPRRPDADRARWPSPAPSPPTSCSSTSPRRSTGSGRCAAASDPAAARRWRDGIGAAIAAPPARRHVARATSATSPRRIRLIPVLDRAPDRGTPPNGAGGAAAAVSAPGSVRRSAADPLGGPRAAPAAARGDQPAVADEPGPRRIARRRSTRSAPRWSSSTRRSSPSRRGCIGPSTRPSAGPMTDAVVRSPTCAGAPGSAATATAIRA